MSNQQLTFEDEKHKRNRPESTRQERIDQLTKMGKQRMAEAEWWQSLGNNLTATHLRQCAANDFALAAMIRR